MSFVNPNLPNQVYRIMGISDDVTTCECCGRNNLKKTVAISDSDNNVLHLGVTCAAKHLKVKVKEVNERIKEIETTEKQRKKELEQEICRFINSHPLTLQKYQEQKEANKKNIPFKQRQEMGLVKRWLELDEQVKKEAHNKYMVS